MSDRYSDTSLMLKQWYLGVMRDPHASVPIRTEAAAQLLAIWPELFPDTYHMTPADLTVVIEGLGNNPPEICEREPVPKPELDTRLCEAKVQADVQDQDTSVLGRLSHVPGWH